MRQAQKITDRQTTLETSFFFGFCKTRSRNLVLTWYILAISMIVSPLSSFQQVDHDKRLSHSTLALQRQKSAPKNHSERFHLLDLSEGRIHITQRKTISLPSSLQVSLADLEIIAQHATEESVSEEIHLPPIGPLQYILSDGEIHLMFHLSNASWIKDIDMSDSEIDRAFRQEIKPLDS